MANTLAGRSGGGVRLFGALRALALVIPLAMAAVPDASAADAEAGRRKAATCAACHGPGGNATIPGMPSIAGQPTMYTHWQLIKYRDGRRKDPQMSPLAANMSDEDMADLAAYFAAQPAKARPAGVDPARIADGKRIAEYYHCSSCHRPQFTGHEQVPRLAGQDLAYLVKLIRGFKQKTASDLDGTMTMAAQPLREEDIDPLAHYIASLGQ
jgi:cytochrome c553